MNHNAAIEKLVLEYLEKRGLSATTKQLKAESQLLAQQMSLAPNRGTSGVATDLLFYLAAGGKPAQYAKSFDSLVAWVDNSLDMYRFELSQVLYPVFIHCCLQLVKNEAMNEATQLISRHSQRFSVVAGLSSKIRMQEINELQSLTMPEHLTTNRLAQAVSKNRYPVTLCIYSYQLLMHFLEGAHLHLILAIVNERLNIQVVAALATKEMQVEEGLPKDLADSSEKETSLLSGDIEAGTSEANLSEINLNLLQGLAEDKYATAKAAEQAGDIPDHDEDGKPLTKKEKMARQRAAIREKDALASAEANRMEPEIPLPAVTEAVLEEQMADIAARVRLSSDALPSAAFFTFVNTHQTLNCAAFNQNGSLVAGGFQDASVRVYNVEKASAARDADDDESGADSLDFHGHSAPVYSVDIGPDSQILMSASGDGTLRLWHLPLAACLNSYRGHIYPAWDVAIGPYGHYFASASADRTARVWSLERNRPLRILTGHFSDVDVVRWHPNGHFLASGSSDHTLRLWDIRDGQAQRVLIGHRANVTALAFHPDGKTMASADEDGIVIIWDLALAKRLAWAEKHKAAIWSLAYCQGGGQVLASGGADDCIKLWDVSKAQGEGTDLAMLRDLRTKATPVFCTQFTPRNLLLGAGALTLPKPSRA